LESVFFLNGISNSSLFSLIRMSRMRRYRPKRSVLILYLILFRFVSNRSSNLLSCTRNQYDVIPSCVGALQQQWIYVKTIFEFTSSIVCGITGGWCW
jgi:hypothetical protein